MHVTNPFCTLPILPAAADEGAGGVRMSAQRRTALAKLPDVIAWLTDALQNSGNDSCGHGPDAAR